ncbi:MAG: response regulator [Thermoproteota archaeon]|nr:response regulator [Thermoproteota archaeon]
MAPPQPAATDVDKDNNSNPPARLLVVDDDHDTVRVLTLSLVNYGFLVDAFTNAEEALREFKSNPKSYHLVLSDSLMPQLPGTELAKKVKDANPNVKVLLLTGSDTLHNEASKVSISTSVDGVVQKPIGIRKLTDKIASLIGETKDMRFFKG